MVTALSTTVTWLQLCNREKERESLGNSEKSFLKLLILACGSQPETTAVYLVAIVRSLGIITSANPYW